MPALLPAPRAPAFVVRRASPHPAPSRRPRTRTRAADNSPPPPPGGDNRLPDAERATEKFGLEAGLWRVWRSDGDGTSKTEQAKSLLKTYGSAYLLTSISFAAVSFAGCYAAVTAGVDVGALLARVGLTVNATSEKVGAFAIAYAAHKALSPVRFPPTVALTPVVARWLGRKPAVDEGEK